VRQKFLEKYQRESKENRRSRDLNLSEVAYIVLAVSVVFLLSRELVCWHWKINRAITLLEQIATNTSSIDEKTYVAIGSDAELPRQS